VRIVVTGASGRVGRAIHVCLSPGHEVIGYDRAPSSTADVVGALDDEALLRRTLLHADTVVHTAALHAPHVGIVPDAEFERINVAGTRALIEAARAGGVGRIVFTSTTALYGAAAEGTDQAAWIDEDTPPQPQTIYHRTKLAAEALLREAADAGGPSVRILRMSRCFPEPAQVMAAFRLHRGVDARDVARAHALAVVHAGRPHHTWVISGATPFLREDARELARDAARVIRRRAPALAVMCAARGWPLPASIDRVYDAARAERELGWRARHGHEAVFECHDLGYSEVLPPTDGRRGLRPPGD